MRALALFVLVMALGTIRPAQQIGPHLREPVRSAPEVSELQAPVLPKPPRPEIPWLHAFRFKDLEKGSVVAPTTTVSLPPQELATPTTLGPQPPTSAPSTVVNTPHRAAPTHLIPAWYPPALRTPGSCSTPNGSRPLGFTDTFRAVEWCASTGHGPTVDLYIYTHEIFHTATFGLPETGIDCLTQLYLQAPLPTQAYGCPNPEAYRDIYNAVISGTYDRPPLATCDTEVVESVELNRWICLGE